MPGITRYDQPAQAEFMNTYVPIPFDEMMKVGMMKQQMVEANDKAADEAVASLATFQVAPFDEKNYLDIRKNYETKLNDLYNVTGGSGSYEFKRGVAKLRTEMAMDPTLRGMQYNLGQYQTAMKAREDARNAGSTTANTYDLDKSLQDITEKGGTVGLMKETGDSKWTPGSWYKNSDVKAGIEKYVDNVIESSNQFDDLQQDASGAYIVSQLRAGKSLNALAAPYGLTYKQEKDPATGKVGYKLTDAGGAMRIMSDFLQTVEGQQLLRDAREEAGKTDGDVMKIAAEKYFSQIGSAINERVSTKGEYNITYDPKWLADYNRSQDDKQRPFVQFQAMGIPKGDIASMADVHKKENDLVKQIDEVDARMKAYMDTYGVTSSMDMNAVDKNGMVVGRKKDEDGVEVSLRMKMFNEEKAQIERTQKALEKKTRDAKKKAGLNLGWTVAQDFTPEQMAKIEEEAWSEAQAGSEDTKGAGKDFSKIQEDYNKILTKKLERRSQNYAKVNSLLKEDAAASSEIVGVSNLPSKADSKYMEDMWGPWVAENGKGTRLGGGSMVVRDMKTMEPLNSKEYGKLSGTATFEGVTYSATDQSLLLVYRPYIKGEDGNIVYRDPVVITAPHGTEQRLIDAGWETAVGIEVRKQLADIEGDYAKEAQIGFGDKKLDVVKLQPSDRGYSPNGANYKVIGEGVEKIRDEKGNFTNTGYEGKKEYMATDLSSIIEWYLRDYLPANSTK